MTESPTTHHPLTASASPDGRLPLFILVHSNFHDILAPLLEELFSQSHGLSESHHLLKLHDKNRSFSQSGSSFESKMYLNSAGLLQEMSESISQEPIFSLATNSLQHVCEAYVSFGNAQVALENIYLYRGRMKIILVLLSEDAECEWISMGENDFPRYNPQRDESTKSKKTKKSTRAPVLLVEKPLDSQNDFHLIRFRMEQYQQNQEIVDQLLWVLKPELMLQRQQEHTIRGHYLNEFVGQSSHNASQRDRTQSLSAEEYAQQEVYPHLMPLLRRVTDCFQAQREGKQLDGESQRIIEKPLLYLSQELRVLSEEHRGE
mmetsp:Transcript_3925/g.14860  ORF Transcript_3925/g.14860 Transcript_3925/m.14860 type:complete len:318 (+) Transcript_3925:29-982(+)